MDARHEIMDEVTQKVMDREYRTLYRNTCKNAYRRGLKFDLPFDLYTRLVLRAEHHCEVSGIAFSFAPPKFGRRRPFAPSIDRLDSSIGYNYRNCRMVCAAVNLAMNEWGLHTLITVARAVVEKQTPPPPKTLPRSWVPIDHRTVTAFLQTADPNTNCRTIPGLSASVLKRCRTIASELGVSAHHVHDPTYRRVDGTWQTTDREAYPLDVLREAFAQAAPLVEKARREREEGEEFWVAFHAFYAEWKKRKAEELVAGVTETPARDAAQTFFGGDSQALSQK